LSKYSCDTCPDRSVKVPDSRQTASMSAASEASAVTTVTLA
jgi:hypothetical protein